VSGFGIIYRHILRKLLRLRRLVGLGAVSAVPALLLLVIERRDFGSAKAAYQELTAQLFLAVVIPLVTLLLASAALGDERRNKTMPYLYLKPVRRSVIVGAATAAAFSAAMVVGLIGWAAGWVVSSLQTGSWALAVPVLAALAINAALYSAVFLPLGYLSRWSVLIGLAYIFVWEAALASAIDALGSSSLLRIGMSAYAALTDLSRDALEILGSVTPGVGGAVAKTVVILGLSAALTTTVLRRTDTR